jgi:GDPmannose 4,6-dehydratase
MVFVLKEKGKYFMNKSSIVWGITGQVASYLAEALLEKGQDVYGIKRRTSTDNTQNISGILNHPNFHLLEGDVCDQTSVNQLTNSIKPDYMFCGAAQSHVATSFSQPAYTFDVNARGHLFILESVRLFSPDTRVQFASTSECFGDNYSTRPLWRDMPGENGHNIKVPDGVEKYQDENTPFMPNSPYAVAKVSATHLTQLYRKAYNLHASNTITFNHESPRRGENFVSRKITKWIADNCIIENLTLTKGNLVPLDYLPTLKIKDGAKLKLGNIDSIRDWGYAPDYVRAFIKVVEHDTPDDYVIGTGEAHTIKEFLEEAFLYVGADWQDYVEIDPELYRPCEVPYLRCDASKIKRILGWEPTVKFKELVKIMMEHDLSQKINGKI